MKQQKLLSLIRQAIEEYHMLEAGDRVAVGVSGGKDSLTLLYAMRQLQRFYPKTLNYLRLHVMWDLRGWILPEFQISATVCKSPMSRLTQRLPRLSFRGIRDKTMLSVCEAEKRCNV